MTDKELAAMKKLIHASGDLYRLALHRDNYNVTYTVIGKTLEQAFDDALLELSDALQDAGLVYHKATHDCHD
jgi:hypothetical protein